MDSYLRPELEGLPQVPSVNSKDLALGLEYSLRTPKVSIEALATPLDLGTINWKAIDARELLNAVGMAYELDRMRQRADRAVARYEDRNITSQLNRAPKVAKKQRKRTERYNRMAAKRLYRDMAYILGMKQKNLY